MPILLMVNGVRAFLVSLLALLIFTVPAWSQTAACNQISGTTASVASNGATGTLSEQFATGTFTSNFTFDTSDFASVVATGGTSGAQFGFKSASPSPVPDDYAVDWSIAPDSGSFLTEVIICAAPYQNSGSAEPQQLKLTWSGGVSGTIIDPDNQITSHSNGQTINSGDTLTFADAVALGTTYIGGGLTGPATWGVRINTGVISSPVSISAVSFGCPSNGGGFCSQTTTSSNVTGERYGEWITFNAGLYKPVSSMRVVKLADQDTNVPAGTNVNYSFVVTNDGNQTLTGISLVDSSNGSGPDPVPTLVSSSPLTDVAPLGDSTDDGVDAVWDVLAPGDSISYEGTYTVTQSDVDNLQ